jgi:hypothetical protein
MQDEGISVQLKFLEGEGDRDKVIAFTADGQELVSCHQVTGTMDFQHNRSVGMYMCVRVLFCMHDHACVCI